MATTRYVLSLRVEFSSIDDRNKVYDRIKAETLSSKSDSTITLAEMHKEEYTKPDMSSEKL